MNNFTFILGSSNILSSVIKGKRKVNLSYIVKAFKGQKEAHLYRILGLKFTTLTSKFGQCHYYQWLDYKTYGTSSVLLVDAWRNSDSSNLKLNLFDFEEGIYQTSKNLDIGRGQTLRSSESSFSYFAQKVIVSYERNAGSRWTQIPRTSVGFLMVSNPWGNSCSISHLFCSGWTRLLVIMVTTTKNKDKTKRLHPLRPLKRQKTSLVVSISTRHLQPHDFSSRKNFSRAQSINLYSNAHCHESNKRNDQINDSTWSAQVKRKNDQTHDSTWSAQVRAILR